jgi:hypothetical protein
MAAAWGAAAEVPGNVSNPGTEVFPRLAAVTSGFCRTVPPVEEKFPTEMDEPSGLKKTRRGPSELNFSTLCFEPPTKTLVGEAPAALTAATLKASGTHGCPLVLPAVLTDRQPLPVSKCKKREIPE